MDIAVWVIVVSYDYDDFVISCSLLRMTVDFKDFEYYQIFMYIYFMKAVALIFSIFFFTISVVPCADICEDLGFIAVSHNDNAGNTSQDTCPVFCICNCCGVVIGADVSAINISSPDNVSTSFGSFLVNGHPSGYNTSIWQPPKQA
ncbi:MAG: DUF6660 family protein [Bacteroidota bacterium]